MIFRDWSFDSSSRVSRICRCKQAFDNKSALPYLYSSVCYNVLSYLRSCRMWCWTLSMERSLAGWPSKDPLSMRCLVQALGIENNFYSFPGVEYVGRNMRWLVISTLLTLLSARKGDGTSAKFHHHSVYHWKWINIILFVSVSTCLSNNQAVN